jgi:hypothetical protein
MEQLLDHLTCAPSTHVDSIPVRRR